DVRLPALDLVTNGLELVMHAQRLHLVPGCPQRANDVVFGFPIAGFLFAEPFVRFRWNEVRVHEDQDAKLAHNAIHFRRDGPNNACIVLAVNRTVKSATSFRSEPTARRLSSRQRVIISSTTASRVS